MASDTASAPERISIKRRRQEEPVETLYLEHGAGSDRKRRVTDFYFQRLRDDIIAPLSQRDIPAPSSLSMTKPSPRPAVSGIPTVRWTSPGDEKKDFEKLKAALRSQEGKENEKASHSTTSDESSSSQPALTTPASDTTALEKARRFHLTRHLSSVLSPNASGGIRKQKLSIRPPLATFVERQSAVFSHEQNPMYQGHPVDKVLEIAQGDNTEASLEALSASRRHATKTFVQAGPGTAKTGTSIRDHPSTWDHQSDQLADELAALAMELDPDARPEPEPEQPTPSVPPVKDVAMSSPDGDDDYVYETYVRIQAGTETQPALSNVGILVIEDEDEDLWQKYVDSDDDTDWDEEDSNAEDNPSNDYPEDEVSSDDEFGYNPYKYRHGGSDNESF